jgi:hypothetical protein
MSAADKRVAELLERWTTSVELHTRYLALDDAAYAKVQDWPKHQRPTRWVVELARTRLLELKRDADERRSQGDTTFAEALELMAFLTNLLGSEHVERFIPLAQPLGTPQQAPATHAGPARNVPKDEQTVETRSLRGAATPKAARRGEPQRTESRTAPAARPARAPAPAPRRTSTQSPKSAPVADEPASNAQATSTVIADAVRLISWGREWPQLAGLIARLANRPPEAEVWKILRKHRAEIETQARRPRD